MFSTEWIKVWIRFGLYCFCIANVCSQTTDEPARSTKPEEWSLEHLCGRTIYTYGGILNFDSSRLSGAGCNVHVIGIGPNDTMLSLFFTYMNVSDGCPANVTLTEPKAQTADVRTGLFRTYCRQDPNLNPNLMFTTTADKLIVRYRREDVRRYVTNNNPVKMMFSLKISAFTSRHGGCTENEINERDMASCDTGRCVHKSLLCKDLNPCGDHFGCTNNTRADTGAATDGNGLEFVKVTVIIVVVVFGLFAAIQICLILRNQKKVCGWGNKRGGDHTRDGAGVEAEFLPVIYGQKVESRKGHSDIEATFVSADDTGSANGHTRHHHK